MPFLPMNSRMRHLTALVAALAALALPAVAMASPGAVVRDCAEDGSVDGNYSNADKRAALDQIPADLDEYSDCRAVIAASVGGGKAKGSGNGGSGGAPAARAAKSAAARKKKKEQARKRKEKREATQLALGDRQIDPSRAGVFNAADTANGVPTSVVLALVALALLCAVGGFVALRKRNIGLPAALSRVPIPRLRR